MPKPPGAAGTQNYLDRMRDLTPQSAKLHAAASRVTPGGLSHNARQSAPYPIYIQRAKGSRIWDVDGREYIDLWMAHYDAILGHAPPEIVNPVREVMGDGLHIGLAIEPEVRLAERVCEVVPSAEQVRFCSSGTEATMFAVRLARAFTGRSGILKMAGGWHGANTDLMVDVFPPQMGVPEGRGLPPELTRATRSTTYNDIEDTARVMGEMGDDLAAVILEPVLGAGGMIPAEPEYLAFLREETRRRGALLIFDEVITGFRLGLGGAQGYFGVTPDMSTLGKVLGGGLPIGAVVGRADVMEPSSIARKVPKEERVIVGGGTYSCNPLSMTAGIAVVDQLRSLGDAFYATLDQRNRTFCAGIEAAFERVGIPVTVTAPGSLHAVHFTREAGQPVRSMADVLGHTDLAKQHELADRLRVHGVFEFHSGALSQAHGDDEVETLIAAFGKVAEEMAENGG